MDMTSKQAAKRIFGTGIVCTGLLVLAIGLIIGLQFPGFVYNKNLFDVCVEDKAHPRYNTWVNDGYLKKYNRLYYWELTNKDDFLYNGKVPKVQSRGPYVYREVGGKVAVRFSSRVVRFHERRRQDFQPGLTIRECGAHCTEDDQITVLNTRYLEQVTQYGGTENYGLSRLPEVMVMTLTKVTRLLHGYISKDTMDQTLGEFGRANGSVVESLGTQLGYPEGFWGLPFPVWLASQPLDYRTVITESREGRNFTSREMAGVYNAMTNPLLLGSSKEILGDDTVREKCIKNALSFPGVDTEKSYHLFSETLRFVHTFNAISPSERPCGLLTYLKLCHEYKKSFVSKSSHSLYNVSNIIGQYLCTNVNQSCLELPDNLTVRKAYINALYDYIFSHLPTFVHHHVTLMFPGELVRTFRQQELALGWWEGGVNTEGSYVQNFTWVPGVLANHTSDEEAVAQTKEVALRTCNDSPAAKTNMMWHAFGGQESVPDAWFPNVTASQRSIHSSRHHVPPPLNITACRAHDLQQHRQVFFDPDFYRQMAFVRQESDSLGGVRVVRLLFNTSDLSVRSGWASKPGLQDMTQVWGYQGSISLPHFLEAGEILQSRFQTQPDHHRHIPYVDIQPITGEVYRRAMRYQHNAAVSAEVQTLGSRSYHITYTNQPIPVYWVEKSFTINSEGIRDYKQRVGQLMDTSCGGLVGLSVVASIIMLGGILSAMITVKDGRIMPINDDHGHSTHYS